MSIPPPDHACWSRLISGQMPQFKTRQAALMFLLKKLQGSPQALDERKRSLLDFFTKYERVLGAEIDQLRN
jgi:hypothetical protein